MQEDAIVADDARRLEPGVRIRQARCSNGHSMTAVLAPPRISRLDWLVVCDMCLEPFLTDNERAKRHRACRPEFHRRRMRLRNLVSA
jgi:hypothetical protein